MKAKDQFKGGASEGVSAALAAYGDRDAVIIGSSLIHYSFDKAADLLGIGSNNLIRVPTDENGRIDLDLLRRTILRCRKLNRRIIALIGVAGATDCGAIDPLVEMAEIAREHQIYFHVDAAWGGPLLFSRLHKDKLNGIEMAHSVTIDGHKQLYLPMGLGMVLLRDPQSAKVIERNAQYIIRSGSHDLGKRALEGSRPAMALYLHASLSIFGSRGYEILIDESMRMARFMADAIREKPEFQLLMEPQLNIVTYRYVPKPWREKIPALDESDNDAVSRFNIRLQKAQRREGKGFVSRTRLGRTRFGNSVVALRAVIANPLTTEHDIRTVLDDQIRLSALEGVSCE